MAGKEQSTAGDQHAAEAMLRIIWQVPPLYHRLTAAAEVLYAPHGLTPGKRSLLNDLAAKGPHTLADMVRMRPSVSRQYIQRLVAELRTQGLVELRSAPEDRRAKTVTLSESGRRVIGALRPLELQTAGTLAAELDLQQVRDACEVLTAMIVRLDCMPATQGQPERHLDRA